MTSVRIGNCSGFYGDRISAMSEMLTGGRLDVLTGDYLAELTMLILARQKAKDPDAGFAKTFLTQVKADLATALDKKVKLVSNAGGMNPSALAEAISSFANSENLDVKVAWIDGDDITTRAAEFDLGEPLAANAYLGGFGIARALAAGADIVVTGRVTDASVITGAATWFHGWTRSDLDPLAGASVAGHVIECGAQATGGNYAFFTEIEDMTRPGFPIAEIAADGTAVITKHPGSGGVVTTETVLSQLLYEIQGARYAGPDVTTRLDSIQLQADGPDRVRIHSVRGEAPPPDYKVSVTEIGGYINSLTYLLTGLDIEAKAELARAQFENCLTVTPESVSWELIHSDHSDADVQAEATARLTVTARDADKHNVGRAFSNAAVESSLTNYPGLYMDSPPSDGHVYGRYRPAYVSQAAVSHRVHLWDGSVEDIPAPERTKPLLPTGLDTNSPAGTASAAAAEGNSLETATVRAPLGWIIGARSGDKGGNANVGVWVRSDPAWDWLRAFLTADRFRFLLPEAASLPINRVELANLRSINFVVEGLLGEGVASQARYDAQAKAVGEWLRSRWVDVPSGLVPRHLVQSASEAREI